MPPRWFYDERGSLLFDEITRLPEYYPTRRETEILRAHSAEVADLTAATALIELGSGLSTKTRLLLSAFAARGGPLLFVPLDVSVEVMTDAAETIGAEHPRFEVRPMAADFTDDFGTLPGTPGRRLVAFLGGTIGNFDEHQRADFLDRLRAALVPGDHLLLGTDLIKSASRLIAAYDDSAGVTAAFNRNLLEVLRRELGASGLYADDFEHVARWNPQRSRVEMWLRARRPVHVHFAALERDWDLQAGDELLTEVSTKFDLGALRSELGGSGFAPVRSWTDTADDYALTLAAAS
jgi:L-histidine N-alpha-methyltransferase